jgi:hypothetical protein
LSCIHHTHTHRRTLAVSALSSHKEWQGRCGGCTTYRRPAGSRCSSSHLHERAKRPPAQRMVSSTLRRRCKGTSERSERERERVSGADRRQSEIER